MKIPINQIVQFIISQSDKHNIDETHSLNHALDVLNFSKKIYDKQIEYEPILENQQHIIYTSALLHDTCDSKYMKPESGIQDICSFLSYHEYEKKDVDTIIDIVDNMSYHKIKEYGFPDLKEYQTAFNVVREADLLAGYDFNRIILYGIHMNKLDYINSVEISKKLYYKRMDKHIDDELFITKVGKEYGEILNSHNKQNIKSIENLINTIENKEF
jgi:HD superfamily phosphodiesterase